VTQAHRQRSRGKGREGGINTEKRTLVGPANGVWTHGKGMHNFEKEKNSTMEADGKFGRAGRGNRNGGGTFHSNFIGRGRGKLDLRGSGGKGNLIP